MNDWNYLTTQEAKQSIKEGNTKEELQDQFCISKTQLENLLSGKIKKFKIPKKSMWHESNQG